MLGMHEGDDYIEDPENLGLYEVNVIANYDADIIAHLNAPAGSHFARNEQGVWDEQNSSLFYFSPHGIFEQGFHSLSPVKHTTCLRLYL